jgi:hypothetical protein
MIPNSLKPINRIENGTQAILGNDNRPAENELSVLPNPLNFIIANPMRVPNVIEIENPATSLPKVIPILFGNKRFEIILANDSATIAGEGNEILGHIPNMNTTCQAPMKIAKKSAALAASCKLY